MNRTPVNAELYFYSDVECRHVSAAQCTLHHNKIKVVL
jgi:hypothetical protein